MTKLLGTVWEIFNPNDPDEIGGYRWQLQGDTFDAVGKPTFDNADDCREALLTFRNLYFPRCETEIDSDSRSNFDFLV